MLWRKTSREGEKCDMFFGGVCGAAILTVVFVREGLADLATEKDFEELYKQGLQSGRAALPRKRQERVSESGREQ